MFLVDREYDILSSNCTHLIPYYDIIICSYSTENKIISRLRNDLFFNCEKTKMFFVKVIISSVGMHRPKGLIWYHQQRTVHSSSGNPLCTRTNCDHWWGNQEEQMRSKGTIDSIDGSSTFCVILFPPCSLGDFWSNLDLPLWSVD